MKYRVITDTERGFTAQRCQGLFYPWTTIAHSGGLVSVDTLAAATEIVESAAYLDAKRQKEDDDARTFRWRVVMAWPESYMQRKREALDNDRRNKGGPQR